MSADHYDYLQKLSSDAVGQNNADYYGSNLAYQNEQFKLDQIRKVAAMGAERLSQYGPEGQQWARHLSTDPYAAMEMAQLQGGFGAIESRLRYAAAMKNATTDQEQLRAAGESYGLPEQIDLMNAQASMSKSEAEKVYGTGKGQHPFKVINGEIQYLPGFSEAQAQNELDPRFFKPDVQGIIRDVRTGQPAFPGQNPIDQARWTDVRTPRDVKAAAYEDIAKKAELLDIADPEDPAWQRAVITITNKMLDSSAVMQGESTATAAMVRSQAGKISNRIQNLATNQDNPLTPEEIRMIVTQAKTMASKLLAYAPKEVENWDKENARLGGRPGEPLVEYATPREWVARATSASQALKSSTPALTPTITPREHAAAVDTLVGQGIPEEAITPEMVLDLVETGKGSNEAPAPAVPLNSPPTAAEIVRAMQSAKGAGNGR